MTKGIGALAAAVFALATSAACTVQQADSAPPLTGPSGVFQDITVTATPDVITRDGVSQSAIVVRVFGPNGQPASAVPLRVDILDSTGIPVDFGTLSTKQIVTGTDGRATTVYTAPPPPPPTAGGTTTFATIRAIALGNDALNSKSFTAEIRLVPPGVILPPAGTPTAAFTFSPQPAAANLQLQFDASTSQPGTGASQIVSYNWTFGDGSSATGKTPTHTFAASNIYNVTLTVTNDRSLSASTTLPVSVVAGALPTPTFTVSPAAPAVGTQVFFNASAATAGPGHSIAAYGWAFGDGATGSGVSTSHAYTVAGTYTVQLTVTDDVGLSATSAGTAVTVGNQAAPTANFTFSPASPSVGDAVLFDYRSTTLANGQAIVALDWNFGDGTAPVRCPGNAACASDGITTHVFTRAGTFVVALVTTDAAGRTGTISRPVTVSAPGAGTLPTAVFTFSPAAPGVGETVFFNASTSTAGTGHTIASYAWTFGDGTTGTGVTVTKAYTTAGSYAVQLRVTDEAGQATTSGATTLAVGSTALNPGAAFTFSPASPGRNDLVVFDASSSTIAAGQTIQFVDWNFGDGTPVIRCPGTSTDCQATNNRISSHTFTTAQTFVVNLVVTDSANRTGSISRNVVIVLAEPTVSITTSPASPTPGDTVSFNSNGTTYFPGSGPATFAWTFGDGGTSTLANPTRAYAAPGVYTVGLSVTDTKGRTGTRTVAVTVVSGNPTAVLTISKTGGNSILADGGGSTSVGSATIASYAFVWGDGTANTGPGTTSSAAHTYAAAGTYTVRLNVVDSLGRSGTTSQSVTIP